MTESVFCLSQSPESEIEKELWELLHYFDDTQGYIMLPFSVAKVKLRRMLKIMDQNRIRSRTYH